MNLKTAHTFTFVKGDAPAVAVRSTAATAAHQPGKAEADIGWYVGAHTQ